MLPGGASVPAPASYIKRMPATALSGISHACFGLSFLAALTLEAARWRYPAKWLRVVSLAFGAAGLFAMTVYLALHKPTLAAPDGSMLLLAWVLGVFYFFGSLHHPGQAWAIFVLPVILALIALAFVLIAPDAETAASIPGWLTGERLGGAIHGLLLLGAAVGVSVAFVASVMYLVQSERLRAKSMPLVSLKMLSLERLEHMSRRAITLATPLLTAGLILGGLLLHKDRTSAASWLSIKVLGTAGLWMVCLVLLYLRYGAAVSGRRLAVLSIVAFVILVAVLAATHPFAEGAS
jgi:ABC-type transport system involved in cytochrome c biogenesis permease subunit